MNVQPGESVWDDWNASKAPRYPHEKVVQFVMRNFGYPLAQGKQALDLGCGSGVHIAFLAACGFEVTGVDGSVVGISNAAELVGGLHARVDLQQAQISTFEAEPSSFDCLISIGVLDAAGIDEASKAIPRILGCLRPGGKALLVFAAEGDFRLEQVTDLGLHGYTREEVATLFDIADQAECWVDQYITTYENGRLSQIDWLVTLTKK